ncbi:MAG: tight adherence protein [Candidatus Eremiobacteraeota bacterium]|nr:tight adherence protein [Candidatus Eremiobacteraeota bacterium]
MTAQALAFIAAVLAVTGIASLNASRTRGQTRPTLAKRIANAIPARLRPPLDLAARIEAAGSPGGLGAGEVMAVKALSALAAAPIGTALGAAAPGRIGLLLALAAPAAGFLAPDWYLARRRRERIRATRRDLPPLLDLLRVAVDAGLAPSRALAAVGERSDSQLAAEWAAAAAQVQLGIPLADALDTLTRRLPAPELRTFTAALGRAAIHGAPLSDTLAAQARDARQQRRRRIEEEAAKASPKIQLVVALLLVPSVLLIVAAALAAAMLGGHAGVLGR